ncbi:unnamed protein product [Cuscuta europaea]|uniref:Phytochrome n=2 Tax=Cuscuta europaea TaxID=41803 RepID=A0A9P1EGT7_CUSEU|nr:unnamed protein product [Cuscuta europaea]
MSAERFKQIELRSSATMASQPSGSTSSGSNRDDSMNKAVAQYPVDARLHAAFEQSGESFDYYSSVKTAADVVLPDQDIVAYLSNIQRGGYIQSFGCVIAVEDEAGYGVIAYSENARQLLGIMPHNVEPLEFWTDVRTLFAPSSSALLQRAFREPDITLLNPIWVQTKKSGKHFYAILHKIDVGIVIDLEPASDDDPALSLAGAVQSQKLAVMAISRFQSLPGGDVQLLCDTVVESVRELTGYDRVMVYKFHDDHHGEVVSESKRQDLEPYLGVHYPASDIPQASRFLFKQNRVRMIGDCHSPPVRIIQDKSLSQPLSLVGSTLRAPHGCHAQYMANMGSMASLTLAIIVNGSDEEAVAGNNSMRLWGLVVGHHTTPKCIPFPLRYSCEFLMKAFGLQLKMELQLASQLAEKRVLRTQTLLCDMLLRGSAVEIVTQSPSIKDLVKCDGAALYYHGNYYPLGVTPTEDQIKDICKWLLTSHGDSTGLSTDSLDDAGYPNAASLGDEVCGMAAAYITSRDFLFWFRSRTVKHIKWGGARHYPQDKDEGQRMHPRSSFKVFLDVVKRRSLPWDNAEMDAIHSLQLILRGDSFKDNFSRSNNSKEAVVVDGQQGEIDELSYVAREMVRLIETATAPIFSVDAEGFINGWNAKVAELVGLTVEEALGKSLIRDIVHMESRESAEKLLFNALRGDEDKNIEMKLKTFRTDLNAEVVFLEVNACCSKDYTNKIVGVCFVGQDVTGQKILTDKFVRIQSDYKAIVHSPNPLIPPIFASDENTCCSEWNTAMEKLTGWSKGEMVGKMLVGELFGRVCKLKGPDAMMKFMIVLHHAIGGKDTQKSPFSFYDRNGRYIRTLLTANKRVSMDGRIIGAFCLLQISSCSEEKEEDIRIQRDNEESNDISFSKKKEMAYICQEIKNPLNGIRFTNSLLKSTKLTEYQKQFLETSAACEKQLLKILRDYIVVPENIEDGSLELEREEFCIGSVIDAVVSQVMLLMRERGLKLIHEIPESIKTMAVYGDQSRIQQVLADVLLNMVHHTPPPKGWVQINVQTNLKQISGGITTVHIEFRLACPGKGLPAELVREMFHSSHYATSEGLGLSICRKILKLMNGEIQYVTRSEKCYFIITLELPTSKGGARTIS